MPLPDDRLERILFVTQRFGELRGLASACTGACLIVGVVSWTLLPADSRNVFQHVAFVGMMGALWGIGASEKFYDRSVWFLILMCAAMLVEGLLDLRVARSGGGEHFSKEHHADAI